MIDHPEDSLVDVSFGTKIQLNSSFLGSEINRLIFCKLLCQFWEITNKNVLIELEETNKGSMNIKESILRESYKDDLLFIGRC
jgi:hypothetical protein